MLSRSELGIHFRGVVHLGDVGTLVNLGLWRDIGHAVRLSAAPTAMAVPAATAVAIMAMPCLVRVT